MITQLNLRRGIMVTFKIVPYITRADATICICFFDGSVVDLDCLEEGSEFELVRMSTLERSRGGADVLKREVKSQNFQA